MISIALILLFTYCSCGWFGTEGEVSETTSLKKVPLFANCCFQDDWDAFEEDSTGDMLFLGGPCVGKKLCRTDWREMPALVWTQCCNLRGFDVKIDDVTDIELRAFCGWKPLCK